MGDADVDFFMQGTWDLIIAGSTGYNLTEGEFISTPLENMDPGFQFSQIPDLTMSLWIMDRYFFETTIKEDSEENTFLLGYQGQEDEFVQSVLIGNTRIDIDDYSFLSVSEIPDNSLGASAAFQTQKSYHELMLRYDPSEAAVREFRGKNEITRETFTPVDYERGLLFILPDTDIDSYDVYMESDSGNIRGSDGRLYRKADASDFIISLEEGTLQMRESAGGRILIYYTKNGSSVGDASLGSNALCGVTSGAPDPGAAPVDFDFGVTYLDQDMSDREITIEGKNALLLFNRNEFSPFESLSIYKSPSSLPEEDGRIRFGISDRSSDKEDIDKNLKFKSYTEGSLIKIYVNSNGDRDMYNRYPLSGELETSPYGPDRATEDGSYKKELRLELQTPVGSFLLDPDVIPGSVNVKVNGYTETRYEIDYSTGLVTFNTYIHPNDRIKITYRTTYADTTGGDILFASGNRFFLSDYLTGELGFGIRWNVFKNQYSRTPNQYPGSILGTGGLDYQRDVTKVRIDGGISLTTPDTTGILRLFDMQQSGIEVSLSQNCIFPSSVPEDDTEFLPNVSPSKTNRGILYFKDYYSYTFGGEDLKNYTWTPPDDQIYDYETGSPPGPYAAMAENDGIRDEVMVLEYSIPSGKEWAGAQVPVIKYAAMQDLSDASSITFKIKSDNINENMPGDTKLYLQIGSVSEDLDNDRNLDRESSVYSNGYPFNDTSNNAVLLIGGGGDNRQGNNYLDSEDNDLNSILDLEDENNIVTIDISTDAGLTSLTDLATWKKVTHIFTSEQKKMMSNSSFVRFVVTNEVSSDVSGKLIIGEINIESSPFKAEGGTSAYAKEVFERNSSDPPPELLVDAYPEVEDIFFQDLEISSEQKVLESGWEGGSYTLTGYSTPVPYNMYRKLNLYMRLPSFSGGDITISLTDTKGKGVKCTFTPSAFSEWRKLEIDLEKKRASLDGYSLDPDVSVTSTSNNISMLKVTSTASSGTIYIDEVHFSDPDINISTGTAVSFEHTFEGDVLRLGDASLINNLTFSEEFIHTQKDFSGDLSENTDANNTRTKTGIKTGILDSRLETNLDYSWIEPDFFKTIDHTYTTPLGTETLEYKDSFSETDDAGVLSFSKENSLRGDFDDLFEAEIGTSSSFLYGNITQNWMADFSTKLESNHSYKTALSLSMSSDNYSSPDSVYLSDWLKSYSTLVPENTDSFPDRNINTDSSYSFRGEKRGFRTDISTAVLSSGEDEDRDQTSSGSLKLSFPFYNTETGSDWEIVPSYTRKFSYTSSSVTGSDFLDDQGLWFSDFSKQSYFYTSVPFYEFFSDSNEEIFREKSDYLADSTYTPVFSLLFTRRFGSDLNDLILPSDLLCSFEKEFSKESDSYLNTYRWGGEYITRAINLFGSYGSHPIFDFYKSDEFITKVGYQVTSVDTLTPEDREMSLSNNLYFTGHKNNELSLENRLRINYDNSLDKRYFYDDAYIAYTWLIIPQERIYFRYLSEEDDPEPYLSHTESMLYSTAPETSYNDSNYFSVLLTHESALIFPEKGNFRAIFSVGIEKHRITDYNTSDSLYLMGIQAGIYGKVMF